MRVRLQFREHSNFAEFVMHFRMCFDHQDLTGFLVQFRTCFDHQKVTGFAAKSVWHLQHWQSSSPSEIWLDWPCNLKRVSFIRIWLVLWCNLKRVLVIGKWLGDVGLSGTRTHDLGLSDPVKSQWMGHILNCSTNPAKFERSWIRTRARIILQKGGSQILMVLGTTKCSQKFNPTRALLDLCCKIIRV